MIYIANPKITTPDGKALKKVTSTERIGNNWHE